MRVGVLALFLLAARAAIAAQPLHHDIVVTLDPTAGTVSVTDTVVIPQSGPVPIGLEGPFHRLSIKLNGESLATSRGASLVAKPKGGGPHRLHIAYAKDMSSPRAATGPEGIFLPPSARWLPVVGEGPFTYRLTLRMPSDQRGLVPGRLVDESVADGRYQAVFESETPSDGIVLVAGPYAVEERIHRGIRLRTYFHRDNAQLAAGYLESSARYLDLFGARIGAYPFSAFHVVSAPLPVGLGFPNFTYMGKRVLALPFIRHTSLGHEVLHSWWGNGVYTDYAAGNWSEGLTTYMADYAFAEARDAAKARDMRFRWLRDYAALPPDRDRPVVAFDFKRHDAAQVVGYHKVAFVFHMLRNRIGDPAFEAGLRRFWRGHKFRKAGWPDLKAAFAKESGQDLALFFDQWLHRKGAPTLAVEKVDVTPSGDGYRVGFSLLQDLSTYRLRVPVTVRTGAAPPPPPRRCPDPPDRAKPGRSLRFRGDRGGPTSMSRTFPCPSRWIRTTTFFAAWIRGRRRRSCATSPCPPTRAPWWPPKDRRPTMHGRWRRVFWTPRRPSSTRSKCAVPRTLC